MHSPPRLRSTGCPALSPRQKEYWAFGLSGGIERIEKPVIRVLSIST